MLKRSRRRHYDLIDIYKELLQIAEGITDTFKLYIYNKKDLDKENVIYIINSYLNYA